MMLRWMIASDIHGSAYYCRALIRCFAEEKADRLLLLGDLLYHGPRNDLPRDYQPKAVADMLNGKANDIFAVRGNCDSEVDQMMLDFPMMADYLLLPIGRRMLFATHGHRWNRDCLPPLHSGDILLHGHTHVPCCETVNGITVINPGSVSIPKENSAHSYLIAEEQTLTFKDIDGNILRRIEL